MNKGKHLTKCNCPHGCDNESFSEFCMDCELVHKYIIAEFVYKREQERKANADRGFTNEW